MCNGKSKGSDVQVCRQAGTSVHWTTVLEQKVRQGLRLHTVGHRMSYQNSDWGPDTKKIFAIPPPHQAHQWRSEDTLWGWFSHSTMYILGLELRLSGLVVSTFPH